MQLSVVVATHNEAANIKRCLGSVKSIADELIVIDGASTDNTVTLAKSLGARVIETTNPPIFHINKQKGLDAAKGKWILQLDADEEVSPELAAEIKQVTSMSNSKMHQRSISSHKQALFRKHQALIEARDGRVGEEGGRIVAFFLPRSNYFLGQFLRFAGTYPDGVIRLVKNGHAHFPAKSVHEQIKINGAIGWLEHDLLHYDSPTFSKYLTRANRYTSLTAQELADHHQSLNLSSTIRYLFLKPLSVFLNLYFRHKGFQDGFPGFVFSLFSGLHFAIAYMKYWEMKRQ